MLFDSHMLCSRSKESRKQQCSRHDKENTIKLQIISFKDRAEPSDPLYASHKILKLQNIITSNNCLFIYDQLCDNLLNAFSSYFRLLKNQHRHNTTGSNHFNLNIPRVNTETYETLLRLKQLKIGITQPKKFNFTLICFSNEVNMLDLSKHVSRLSTNSILTSSVKH